MKHVYVVTTGNFHDLFGLVFKFKWVLPSSSTRINITSCHLVGFFWFFFVVAVVGFVVFFCLLVSFEWWDERR